MAINNLGTAYMALGKTSQALDHFEIAIQIDPNYYDAYHNRGLALMDLTKMDQSIKDLSKAIELKPDFWSAYRHRGIAHHLVGDEKASYRDYLAAKNMEKPAGSKFDK